MSAAPACDVFGRCLRCGERVESTGGCSRCTLQIAASGAELAAPPVIYPVEATYPYDGGGIMPLGRRAP